jgi:hypothetical protein
MERTRWTGKRCALVVLAFTLAYVAFVGMEATPRSVSSLGLGSNWQCSKMAFVLTTCAPVR